MTQELHPATPEQQADKPQVAAAKKVILEAEKSAQGTTERFLGIDAYVDKVLQAADDGEITGSAGTYTREQMVRQIQDFLAELNKTVEQREGVDPYTRIPGKDGLRAAFRQMMNSEATYRDFEESLKIHVAAEKERRAELLSADNIQDMGEVEVDSAGVVEPMPPVAPLAEARRAATGLIEGIPDHLKTPTQPELSAMVEAPKLSGAEYLRKLTEGFSDADVSELRAYAEANAAKQQSQSDGDGNNSIYWGQQEGQSYRAMSPAARAIAKQYAHAYQYYA